MSKFTFEGEFTEGIEVRLALLSYIEEDVHVIYSPSLDLYGYGNNEDEAQRSFALTIEEYMRYTHEKNTLQKDLQRIGWTIKPDIRQIEQPTLSQLLKTNPHLDEVMTNRSYRKFDQTVNVPAFA